jgi:hypothetical protein
MSVSSCSSILIFVEENRYIDAVEQSKTTKYDLCIQIQGLHYMSLESFVQNSTRSQKSSHKSSSETLKAVT